MRFKLSRWGTAVGIIIVIGVLTPWLSQSYDSYGVLNPVTGQGETRYHSKIVLSPFSGTIYKDESFVTTVWFVSPGTSLAGFMLIFSAVLGALRSKRIWYTLLISLVSFLGLVFFFLSLGRGISIGVITQVEYGLGVTLLGLTIQISLSLYELVKGSRPPGA